MQLKERSDFYICFEMWYFAVSPSDSVLTFLDEFSLFRSSFVWKHIQHMWKWKCERRGKEYVFTKDKYSTAIYIYYSCDGLKKTFYKSPAHNDHCANGYQSNNHGDCGNRTSNDTNFLLIFSKSYRMFNITMCIYWKRIINSHLITANDE